MGSEQFNLEISSNVWKPAHLWLAPCGHGQALTLMNQQYSQQASVKNQQTQKSTDPKNPKKTRDPKIQKIDRPKNTKKSTHEKNNKSRHDFSEKKKTKKSELGQVLRHVCVSKGPASQLQRKVNAHQECLCCRFPLMEDSRLRTEPRPTVTTYRA